MKFGLLAVLFLMTFSELTLGQSPEEVFQIASQFKDKVGETERDRARYFLGLGLSELKNLRKQQTNGFDLDDDSMQRLQLLESALSPIEEAFNGLRTTKDRVGAKKRLDDLSHDIDQVDKVFLILGPARAMELATGRAIRAVRNRSKATARTAFSPTTFVTSKKVSEYLALTEEQRKNLNRLVTHATAKMRYGSDGHLDKIRALLEQHWKSLLEELDDNQQSAVKKLIGEPIQWFRSTEKQALRARDFSARGGPMVNTGRLVVAGRTLGEIQVEVEKLELEFMHSHVFEMITSPFIWDELDLAAEQRTQMGSKATFKNVVALPSFSEDRISKLLEKGEIRYPRAISDILTKHHSELLRMMELQILTGKYESSVGLLHPSVSKHLDLSLNQANKIRVLSIKFEKDSMLLSKELGDDRKLTQDEFDKSVSSILTEEQKQLLSRLTGKNSR